MRSCGMELKVCYIITVAFDVLDYWGIELSCVPTDIRT
jgi:hypothetical protein